MCNAMTPNEIVMQALKKPYGRMMSGRLRLLSLVGTFHSQQPCRLNKRDEMENVMKACILMNNMIVEAGRNSYESGMYEAADSSADDAQVDFFTFVWQYRDSFELGAATELVQAFSNRFAARYAEFKSSEAHTSLTKNIFAHILNRYGVYEDRCKWKYIY
jgi:Plant transposon protein